IDDESFRRAVLAGYPDRVGQRRAARSDRVLLAPGTGARIGRESGVHNATYLVAVDVGKLASSRPSELALGSGHLALDPIIRIATEIEPEWLTPTAQEVRHVLDADRGIVRATVVDRYDAIVLRERPHSADPDEAATLLFDEYIRRGPSEHDLQLV